MMIQSSVSTMLPRSRSEASSSSGDWGAVAEELSWLTAGAEESWVIRM